MANARRNRVRSGLLCLLLIAAASFWLVACGGGSSSNDSSSETSAQPGTWDQMVWGESTWG